MTDSARRDFPERLEVNIAELRRRVGNQMHVERSFSPEGVAVVGVSLDPSVPVAVELDLECVHDGVTVSGTATGGWVGECRRCLRPLAGSLRAVIDEVAGAAPGPDDGIVGFTGDVVDLTDAVRDAVVEEIPLAPLCDEACLGPDPEGHALTGGSLSLGAEGADEPALDPRWAPLSEVSFDRPAPTGTDGVDTAPGAGDG